MTFQWIYVIVVSGAPKVAGGKISRLWITRHSYIWYFPAFIVSSENQMDSDFLGEYYMLSIVNWC